jgi:thiol-disulfide isomerase/thioredoxin
MSKVKLFIILFYLCAVHSLSAQNFIIKCDTVDYQFKSAPFICMYGNLFSDYLQTRVEMKRKTSYFEGAISIVKPYFLQITNAQLLAIPNQNVTGLLKNNGEFFVIKDSNNINAFLTQFHEKYYNIATRYTPGTSFNKFLLLYSSLREYIDTTLKKSLQFKMKYKINNEALSAIKQFCTAKLAHFSILPLMFKEKYDENLFKIIKRDVKIDNPSYWLQFQAGRIFLKNYFLKVALPANTYNVEKTFSSEILFKDNDIKKYLEYHYFNSLLSNDSTLTNLPAIIKRFSQFENKYSFTAEELKISRQLKEKFDLTGKNIINLFSRQLLVNTNGQLLGREKDSLLKNKGKVIVYYWASWCLPCIKTISTLKFDEVIYNGDKYKLLFISEDKSQKDWLLKKYQVLNSSNSFRLKDVKDPSFYRTFQIEAIPRLFLIDNGILINQNFSKDAFFEMIK